MIFEVSAFEDVYGFIASTNTLPQKAHFVLVLSTSAVLIVLECLLHGVVVILGPETVHGHQCRRGQQSVQRAP